MLFSSWPFIFAFLPVAVIVYHALNHQRLVVAGKVWLVLASLFFYSYWNVAYLPLILGSMLGNFALGTGLAQAGARLGGQPHARHHALNRRIVLAVGIAANLLLLGYYKYTDFLLANLNAGIGTAYALPHIVLPLAISFFTFQQIAFLVDSYRGETVEYDLLNYVLCVSFFPHLIAGPIIHYRDMMSQFTSRWNLALRWSNIARGLFIFSIGLFKKTIIADTFALWADAGFDGGQPLDFWAAWGASLSYTFQLYFDFSGYCDMAIGAALLMNIRLPINFNSPYKALDIQDFWRRWHITLSNFLRDYLYIPLGGSRAGAWRTYLNLFMTFVIGGLWHGASWMFVIWGALHGTALVLHRAWRRLGGRMHRVPAWLVTFLFVNLAWVFFRAKTMPDALRVLRGMVDVRTAMGQSVSTAPTSAFAWGGWLSDWLLRVLPVNVVAHAPSLLAIALAFWLIARRNSMELMTLPPTLVSMSAAAALFVVAVYATLASTTAVFLYFNF